ncbi:response regulator, partial [Candidatus Sumerlaeota bacterium]|nr:response regulator [Candidatus Sumerlaeota bacterium]
DIMMPIMNGLETVEAIRKNPKFYDIPVFFLSGEKHPDLPELTMEAGGNLFLEKPIDPRRLMELVHLFVDEMGITPRVRDEMPKPAPPPKDAAPKPAPAPDETADKNAPPIRVLTIDSNAETLGLLRRILDNSQTGRWEPIWSEDAGESVANLYRLQPDLILYNPRQKMAGIAFLQNLHLRQILHEYEVCFVGTEISPAEEEYNRKISGCDPIRLDTPPEEVVKRIAERIRAARAKYKPKRHTLDELKAQEVKRDEALKSGFNELRKEQFQRMQEHINKTSA